MPLDSGSESESSQRTAASSSSVASSRGRRERKKKRHDDSLADELEKKYKKEKKKKFVKKSRSSKKQPKPSAKSEEERKAKVFQANVLAAINDKNVTLRKSRPIAQRPTSSSTPRTNSNSPSLNGSTNIAEVSRADELPKQLALDSKQRSERAIAANALKERASAGSAPSRSSAGQGLQVTVDLTADVEEDYSPNNTVVKMEKFLSDDETGNNDTLVPDDETDRNKTLLPEDETSNKTLTAEEQTDKKLRRSKSMSPDMLRASNAHSKTNIAKKSKKKRKKNRKSRKSKKNKKSKKRRRRSSSSSESSSSDESDERRKKRKRKRKSSTSSSSSSDSSSSSSSDEIVKRKKNRKENKSVKRLRHDHLLHNSDSSDVEEIVKHSGVYIKTEAKRLIKQHCCSHSAAARNFMAAVLTPKAITECSIMGKLAKGPLGKPVQQREGLFRPALNAILDASRRLAKQKAFQIKDDTVIKKEMGTYQSEQRALARLASESSK
ncbi:Putative BEN domain-containing protein B1 [Frankliniella fusca]|uniref:BEN domain-containing protein B1 n=1 Tax=Frankliniella fusca TaxID=407009 RepID=A0AAE1H0K0_9NEOP|nr:Putative BEN domain-containing protein B1 [Frankliniella fusca]